MPHLFADDAVAAILHHMNTDHSADNVTIVRAFGAPQAASAIMTGLDGDAGEWQATDAAGVTSTVRVAWPGAPLTERPAVRKAVVLLYRDACARLGVEPRTH